MTPIPPAAGFRCASGLLLTLWAGVGCYHGIAPIDSRPLAVEEPLGVFPEGVFLRLESGLEAPVWKWIRSDGIHHMEVDLRDWTARCLVELALELRRRRVVAYVPERGLVGTSAASADVPREAEFPDARIRVLTVWVTDVRAPDPVTRRGPWISVEIESGSGDYAARFSSGVLPLTFEDAWYALKEKILGNVRFQEWLLRGLADRPLRAPGSARQ